MRLADAQSSVELSVVRYEHPSHRPVERDDWDANWLVVSGRVRTVDRAWAFQDACITTWEAEELRDFLSRRTFEVGDQIEFTEPNLSLTCHSVSGNQVELALTLRAESAPPDAGHDERWGGGETLMIHTSVDDIHVVAREWAAEIVGFPAR